MSEETGNALDALDEMFESNDFEVEDVGETELVKTIDEEHIAFETKLIVSILNVVNQVQSSGSNMYDRSILIEPVGDGQYNFKFTSFGVFYQNTLRSNSPTPEKLTGKTILIDINSLGIMCKYAGNNLILYVEPTGVFARVLGGKVEVLAYLGVDLKPFNNPLKDLQECLTNPLSKNTVQTNNINQALKIVALGRTCSSAQQRMLYLTEDAAYVHTGGVSARVEGTFFDVAIQPKGVSAMGKFTYAAPTDIAVSETKNNVLLSFEDTILMISKVGDTLPKAVKELFVKVPDDTTSLQSKILNGIIDVLSSSPLGSGNLEVSVYETGCKIFAKSNSSKQGSEFVVGVCADKPKATVQINLSALKKVISLFKGSLNIQCWVSNETLFMNADPVMVAISGRSDA